MAEHSYWVAMYAKMICDMEFELGGTTENSHAVVYAALLHDWEESVTGDLPSLVKKVCHDDWRKVEERGFAQLIELLHPSHPIRLTASVYWRPDPAIARLVKAADLLDRLIYGWEEQQRGSRVFDKIMAETVKQLRQLDLKCMPLILNELGFDGPGAELPEAMTHL